MDNRDREYTEDDVKHALAQTLHFYNKELDRQVWRLWWSVLKQLNPKSVMHALRDYIAEGKYAPKPADIVEICGRYQQSRSTVAEEKPYVKPPEEIEKAWQFILAAATKGTPFEVFQSALVNDVDLQDRYIHICNHEAKRLNMPEAIPEQFRLREVWG